MKRRNFVHNLLVVPAAAVVAKAQQNAPPPSQPANTPQPTPQPNTPARQIPRQPQNAPSLRMVEVDLTAETVPQFFKAEQFEALQKLGSLLMPPLKGNPGALEAHAPEFLDFLISESPTDRQNLYKQGLDGLNVSAKKHFHKSFAELDTTQADSILKPLLVARPWPQDLPRDPMQAFIAQAHEDFRTATMNSREWAANGSTRGRFNRGSGMYWKPIDPVVRG